MIDKNLTRSKVYLFSSNPLNFLYENKFLSNLIGFLSSTPLAIALQIVQPAEKSPIPIKFLVKMLTRVFLFFVFSWVCNPSLQQLPPPPPPDQGQCSLLETVEKFDCWPYGDASPDRCEKRGCCWRDTLKDNVPSCFYPASYSTYQYWNWTYVDNGFVAYFVREYSSTYPRDVEVVKLEAIQETDNRLHVRITDPTRNRFVPPFPEISETKNRKVNTNISSVFRMVGAGSGNRARDIPGFQIVRPSDEAVLFDTSIAANFVFSDQFLQISAKLQDGPVYGIGERRGPLQVPLQYDPITLFNHDHIPEEQRNLYGTQPFYMAVEETRNAHGVYFRNSNPMDIIVQPGPAITYRAIGGILEFYFLFGPTPEDVISQYTELVGRPAMPPYWGLGYHLCRYGYHDLDTVKTTMERNLAVGIPIETQWADLDYMDHNSDFTYDKDLFAGLPSFVAELHKDHRQFIPIIDPGVSGGEEAGTYPPFDEGVKLNVFVKDHRGDIFYGKVWNPVSTVWPDFFNPNATEYWGLMLKTFHNDVGFDGAWIDMNEPANFIDGAMNKGCPESELEDPPFVPRVDGGVLRSHTMCMTAQHNAGLHYNLHNMFGISEAKVTHKVLSDLRDGKRPMIISRSTYAGQGKYSGHWSGDNASTWEDMKHSIEVLLSFSLFGIPMMGSDICGFRDDTTDALCSRWHQLGAFYPFSRNHNALDRREQDPAIVGELTIASAKKSLHTRYELLPYLYTLFHYANTKGHTVARPLFFEYVDDPKTFSVESQFLWGGGLLINPILEENAKSISIYLPADYWYDYYGEGLRTESTGNTFEFPVEEDHLVLFVRGGHILPTQQTAPTLYQARRLGLGVVAALNRSGEANGELYWDDGETIDAFEKFEYTLISFFASSISNILTTRPAFSGVANLPNLTSVDVWGVDFDGSIKEVLVNYVSTDFTHDEYKNVLTVRNFNLDLSKWNYVQWS